MLVTVKEWLKSVLNYNEVIPKIKLGIRFWTSLYYGQHRRLLE